MKETLQFCIMLCNNKKHKDVGGLGNQSLSQSAKLRHSRAFVTICSLKFGGSAKIVPHNKNLWCVKFKCCFELSCTFSHLWIK